MEPELRPEGRRSLRLGVRTGVSPAFRGLGPTGCLCPPHPSTCLPHRPCSPKRLLLPPPLLKVLQQRSAPGGVEWGGGTKPFCHVPAWVPPQASQLADSTGDGVSELAP